ncbi:MAG: hypothetical protein J7K68_02180 [Candidatus Diapherotrites archaeon]|nr:hypothetical protein [Candidatus Diapherotrites archaeon]
MLRKFLVIILIFVTGCVQQPQYPSPIPQPSPYDFCGEQNISAVNLCLDNAYKVVYSTPGRGFDYYRADGTVIHCPLVSPEYTSQACKEIIEKEYCADEDICSKLTVEVSRQIAEDFVLNSPTFLFDGIPDSFTFVSYETARCPYCWVFYFTFECRHAGYGNRSGQVLLQVITPHNATVAVNRGRVEWAYLDNKWDMIKQRLIECLKDEDCEHTNCTRMFPNPKCKENTCVCVAECTTNQSCSYLGKDYICIEGECVLM